MSKSTYLTTVLFLLPFAPLTLADNSIHYGEGTFYGYGGGGNCSFPVPSQILTAAMNATDYNGSAACGGVIVVTNNDTGLSVKVRIDDQCPECAKGDVDLDQDAFAQIAELATGRIPISWHYVANDQAGSIKLYFKEGSSQWWTAVQVRDHLYPVSRLEYRVTGSGNGYVNVPRTSYNYFVAAAGFGVGPYDFRITDVWGQTVEAGGISLAVTTEIDTGMQFLLHDVDGQGGDDSGGDDTGGDAASPAETSLATISSWNSGYCATVTVTNPNRSPLTWSVSLDASGTVTNLWNARWSQAGTVLTASGVSWNATLGAGAFTEFGFCADY